MKFRHSSYLSNLPPELAILIKWVGLKKLQLSWCED